MIVDRKRCIICDENLPNNPKYFYRNKQCRGGLTPRCKVCIERIRNGNYLIIEHPIKIVDKHKTCTKCGLLKSVTEFYRDRRNPSGYRRDCKDCVKERVKGEYYSNKGKILKRISNYQKTIAGKIVDRRKHSKRRKLGYIEMFPNPFDNSELVEWHHIGDIAYVVAIPRDLHQLYSGKNHKYNCMEIVKQIYLENDNIN